FRRKHAGAKAMNCIRLLPEHVANQIAAGEVVERPASVVKELVENALDAKAKRITVEAQAGGRSLIRVTDDGLGMSRDDALLCLERHATSKIQKAEDLHSIYTMGFRGEALPSIASVSRMTLTTRERESESPSATQIIINGGKIIDVKEAGSPAGTCVEVRQLFFNLPARRKFLRSEETESAHVLHYVTLAALAHPEIAFDYIKDTRVVWQLAAVNADGGHEARLRALQERMRAIFGNETQLLSVDFQSEFPENNPPAEEQAEEISPAARQFRVWGLIGQPGVARATREDQHLFVNRRPVENRALNFALLEGYHTALMKGRFPVCCLFLEIHPALVDVNIHPSKREIKFHNERAVRAFVAEAVRQTLLKFHGSSSPAAASKTEQASLPEIPASQKEAEIAATPELPKFASPSSRINFPWPSTHLKQEEKIAPAPLAQRPSANEAQPVARSHEPERSTAQPAPMATAHAAAPPSAALNVQAQTPTPLLHVPLRLIGVVGKLYVLLESDRGLVLMDQHAAHERILFEQMLTRLESGNPASQRLLLPETVELGARDTQFVRELLPTLNKLGVGLSEFGERTFLLDALPPFVKAPNARQFVLELIDQLKAAGQEVNTMRLGEHMIAKTVCRHAVKANDFLRGPELENLVEDLRACAMPYTCPHGRPTLIEMNYRELEKKFGRLQ
ncbi:MAG TPA: DNA mismatch repair endonuclease MutL, partial [Verrucomicrobiae bacterium]